MTERSTDEQAKTYGELRLHASKLEAENARLKRRTSNQRKELRRLARVERALRAHYRSQGKVSLQEANAENALLREDLAAAKRQVAFLEGKSSHSEPAEPEPPRQPIVTDLGELLKAENGKAAE